MYLDEWDQATARIGVSCAWRMVSKLKARPFHRVNSPLWAPVKTRRPSGVHLVIRRRKSREQMVGLIFKLRCISYSHGKRTLTTLTGLRILLTLECTNFSHRDVDELVG